MALPRWLQLLAARYGVAITNEPVTWEQLVTVVAQLEQKTLDLHQRLATLSGEVRLSPFVVEGYEVIRENQYQLSYLIWTKATRADGGGVPRAELPPPLKAPQLPYWGTEASTGFGAVKLGKQPHIPARSHVGALGANPVAVVAVCGAIVALAGAGAVASFWWASAAAIEAVVAAQVLDRQITAQLVHLETVRACIDEGNSAADCASLEPPENVAATLADIPRQSDRFQQLAEDAGAAILKVALIAGGVYFGWKLLDHFVFKRSN